MRSLRLVLLGFALGAGAAFAVSLIRRQRLADETGYTAPLAAEGPLAVPDLLVGVNGE